MAHDLNPSDYERALRNQLDTVTQEIQDLEHDIADATKENDQLSASVAAFRTMQNQLQEELEALGPLSTDAIETAKYESNEIRKTMLENELVHAEETLRIVAFRIQELIKQRMDRDADADNYARRVLAMQKLINRPRGVGTTSSAAREIKQLEQENRNMQEQIIALRIATSGGELSSGIRAEDYDKKDARSKALMDRKVKQQLSVAAAQKAALDQHEQDLQSTLQSKIVQAEQALRDEYEEKLRQLTVRFEGSRMASMLSARNREENKSMSPKDILKRALEETKRVAAEGVREQRLQKHTEAAAEAPRSTTEQVSELASERAKTTAAARAVAAQVNRFQTLQDENAALLGLLTKMADELRATNGSVKEMADQLEALQLRLKDEVTHRDQWIESDAEHVNASLVASILEKDDELKQLKAQVSEWRQHAERLQTVSPAVHQVVSQSPLSFRGSSAPSGGGSLGGISTPVRSTQLPAYGSGTGGGETKERSSLKRSMLLDL